MFMSIALCLMAGTAAAQSDKTGQVAEKVLELKRAMIDADSLALYRLTSEHLSYGHSAGHVEDRTEFIHKLTSGKSDFRTMELSGQTIRISGKTALVRHRVDANIFDGGKSADVTLLVLQVWQKGKGGWKLLARQATKPVQ
jgi:hypothetical protein